ncbi:PLP-dependent aminotransferase family protein [Gibbsiella quercinecans]|uniref:aminotransferase-like domain-containing protein n=1 Tax=Gibbsiella quercinecans TaxID=929813 RepID=UPI003A4E23D0
MNNFLTLSIDKQSSVTLVEQLMQAFQLAIRSKHFPPGGKLPSIRRCAQMCQVSASTVVIVYDQLIAEGLIKSIPGSGFFVIDKPMNYVNDQQKNQKAVDFPIDDYWLLTNVYYSHTSYSHFGCGWLPSDWYPNNDLSRALRAVARQNISANGYGEPQGFSPLREYLSGYLSDRSLYAAPDNILLTQGASRALDIISAAFLESGDTVLVDEPGYCNFLTSLLMKGVRAIGIPWTDQGPDISVMGKLIKKHRPKLYFTNPWLHNPTGTCMSLNVAYQVLMIAEQQGIKIVEDHVSGDLMPPNSVTLASLGGLERVIHISSYSKTLSPSLRVGYVVADVPTINRLTQYKMMSGLTSSEFVERIVLSLLKEGHYHKSLEKLRAKLALAQAEVGRFLQELGWELFIQPKNGFYIYAKPRGSKMDAQTLAERAKKDGLIFAPGYLFHPQHMRSPWIRFNVAYSLTHKNILISFLKSEDCIRICNGNN